MTVFFGQNGQGKSNLLEAAYYLVGFRSFRTSSMNDVIRWGSVAAQVEAQIELRSLERKLAVELSGGRRRTSLDGKTVRRESDSLHGASVIVFSPGDLQLPKGPASERRRAIDRAVFAVHREYFREAAAFERALRGRNALLKSGAAPETLLDSYDEALASAGARIVERRREVVGALGPLVGEVFAETHAGVVGSVAYQTDSEVGRARGEREVGEALLEGLRATRAGDIRRGFTGYGPQTDDLEILLGERPAKNHASQGQLRSLVLALKIAELRHAEQRNGETPVLLLDDVASELDEERRNRLFGVISGMACQTLITVTERDQLPHLPERRDWRVSRGQVESV